MTLRPYAHAPRLPELPPGELFDLASLFPPVAGFPASGPLELEIGPGRGGFVFERLATSQSRLVGFEIRRKWATIVDERLKQAGLSGRARVFAEDARVALPGLVAASIDAVYVHFPDPWWKKRHHKRLVVGDPFVEQVARVLKPGGELFVQTDVEERAQAYAQVIAGSASLIPFDESAWIPSNPYGARSPREHRAEKDGLPVYRLRYRKA